MLFACLVRVRLTPVHLVDKDTHGFAQLSFRVLSKSAGFSPKGGHISRLIEHDPLKVFLSLSEARPTRTRSAADTTGSIFQLLQVQHFVLSLRVLGVSHETGRYLGGVSNQISSQ